MDLNTKEVALFINKRTSASETCDLRVPICKLILKSSVLFEFCPLSSINFTIPFQGYYNSVLQYYGVKYKNTFCVIPHLNSNTLFFSNKPLEPRF